MPPRKFSPSQCEEIVRLYNTKNINGNQRSTQKIAQLFNSSNTAVYNALKRAGVQLRARGDNNRKLSNEQRAEVVRMYTTRNADGTWNGTKTIASLFRVAPNAIDCIIRIAGIHRRSQKEAMANCRHIKPKMLSSGEPRSE